MSLIEDLIQQNIDLQQKILQDQTLLDSIDQVAAKCISGLKSGGKILFCGNGGSAADAQHIAAELSGRFEMERPGLYAEALHVNTSALTAIANDYGYEAVYARQIEAFGKEGDVLIALSTSGESANIIRAIQQANEQQMTTIAMTGESGGQCAQLSDLSIRIPSTSTPRIQEAHILVGHIICQIVENAIFGRSQT